MQNVFYKRYIKIDLIILSVLCLLFSSCDDLTEEDLSDDVIILLTPIDNTTSTIMSQNFKWEEVDEAVKYRIQIVSPSFTSMQTIVIDSLVTGLQFNYTLEPGTYQWRVKAINYSSESNYSSPYNLTIDTTSDLSNQLVVLTSPVANADRNDSLIQFSWQGMGIADSYNIVVKSGTNFTTGSVLIDDTVTTNNYSSSYIFTEGQYCWGVRAINSISYTNSFNSQLLNIDLTNPPKPIPTTPVHSSTQTQGVINFTWTRPADIGAYNSSRFDSIYIFSDSTLNTSLGKFKSTATNYSQSINQTDTLFWYLIGFDNAGNFSDTSTIFSFIVQ